MKPEEKPFDLTNELDQLAQRQDRILELLDQLIDRTERQAEVERVAICPCGWTGIGNHYHDARMRGRLDGGAEETT